MLQFSNASVFDISSSTEISLIHNTIRPGESGSVLILVLMLGLYLRVPALLFQQILKHVGDSFLVAAAIAGIRQGCADLGLGLCADKERDGRFAAA